MMWISKSVWWFFRLIVKYWSSVKLMVYVFWLKIFVLLLERVMGVYVLMILNVLLVCVWLVILFCWVGVC